MDASSVLERSIASCQANITCWKHLFPQTHLIRLIRSIKPYVIVFEKKTFFFLFWFYIFFYFYFFLFIFFFWWFWFVLRSRTTHSVSKQFVQTRFYCTILIWLTNNYVYWLINYLPDGFLKNYSRSLNCSYESSDHSQMNNLWMDVYVLDQNSIQFELLVEPMKQMQLSDKLELKLRNDEIESD